MKKTGASLIVHTVGALCASILMLISAAACVPKLDEPHGTSAFNVGGAWVDQNGRVHTLGEFRGRPVILAYFFTTCPEICPRLVADMKNLRESLSPAAREGVKFLLVTVDPDTDTTERLSKYAATMGLTDEQWLLLRPTRHDLAALAASMFVGVTGTGTDILHSSSIFLLDQDGFARLRSSNYLAGKRPLVRGAEYLLQEADKGKKR